MKLTYKDFEIAALILLTSKAEWMSPELYRGVVELHRRTAIELAMRDKNVFAKVFNLPSRFLSKIEARFNLWRLAGTTGALKNPLERIVLCGYVTHRIGFNPLDRTERDYYSITPKGSTRLAELTSSPPPSP